MQGQTNFKAISVLTLRYAISYIANLWHNIIITKNVIPYRPETIALKKTVPFSPIYVTKKTLYIKGLKINPSNGRFR